MTKHFFLVGCMAFLTVEVHASLDPKIQQDIHDLKDLGYTGKGVKVGILDDFSPYSQHGAIVKSFILKVAPGVTVYQESIRDVPGPNKSIVDELKSQFGKIKLSVLNKTTLTTLKESALADEKEFFSIIFSSDPLDCFPDKFEKISLNKGESLQLSSFNDYVYEFVRFGKKHYVQLADFIDEDYAVHINEEISLRSSDKAQKLIVGFIEKLLSNSVGIINGSFSLQTGDAIEASLKKIADRGGVYVQSAGNLPFTKGQVEFGLSYVTNFRRDAIAAIADSVRWKNHEHKEKKAKCLVVGALKNQQQIADYSARAGELKREFISAVVDKHNPDGTSFAAPQLTGILALLQEAYPTCQPQTLKKAILKTGATVETDPTGVLTGRGRVDPLAAFKKAYEICGVPPEGLKGQKFLLPADFKVEAYIALNPDVNAHVANMTPAQKEDFGIRHYLSQGKKENRVYQGTSLPQHFDTEHYIYQHPDLIEKTKSMTIQERRVFAANHYQTQGKNEGRGHLPSGPFQSFNADVYLALHSDVKKATQGMTPQDARSFAYWHYAHHGKNESRDYVPLPQGFDPQRYLGLHGDVRDHTRDMSASDANSFAIWHYLNHGKVEGRRY